ncbi:MAG: TolC family protein [Rhodocyclaceae bacterium]|nr:TolC family protein [Rhodocyclaceae bacterium]
MVHYRISCKSRLAVLALALCLCAGSVLAGTGLNEAEALRLGLARPEFSELLQARVGEAEADALAAGTWANPTLELARDKTGATRETSWQLAQPLDLSGRRGLRENAARHRIRATESDNLARRNERAVELRRAFHDLLRQQEMLRAVGGWTARFGTIGGIVDKLARAGEVAGYDRRRLAREQRTAEAKLAETRADLERGRTRLAALIGREVGDGIVGRLIPDAPPALPTLQARLAERPDLAALSARAEAARSDNAAAQRNLPELTVGIGGKRVDDGSARENGNLVMLSFSLPIFDRQQAGDRRSAAQAMAARAELGLARQQAEGDLIGLHRQITQLIAAATRYRSEAVAPSADLVRIAETAYRAGESTILELLDAYKGALEAETTALDLEWKARESRIELDQLTGNHPK